MIMVELGGYRFDLLTALLEVTFMVDVVLVAYCVYLVRRLWKGKHPP